VADLELLTIKIQQMIIESTNDNTPTTPAITYSECYALPLVHGSLFSGIGGFELGAEYSGIQTLWNCEIEPFQRSILKQQFPNTMQYEDIRKLKNPPKVNIISGGFPCQDISSAGGGAGITGEKSGLWAEMYRICREVRPEYIIIENSPNLTIRGFERVLCNLSEIGYDAEWQCLRGTDFGMPHFRNRIYCIAYNLQTRRSRTSQVIFTNKGNLGKHFEPYMPNDGDAIWTAREYAKTGRLVLHKPKDSRNDDELSRQMDRIASLGNAVMPVISHYLFECIKRHANAFYGCA